LTGTGETPENWLVEQKLKVIILAVIVTVVVAVAIAVVDSASCVASSY